MTSQNPITDREIPRGLTVGLRAPFSGELQEDTVKKALARLPESINELRDAWMSIDGVRSSGFAPMFDQGPLDDAVRDGVWRPELQVEMPTVGGLPGSRGRIKAWKYFHEDEDANNTTTPQAFGGARSVKNLIQVFEAGGKERSEDSKAFEEGPNKEQEYFILKEHPCA